MGQTQKWPPSDGKENTRLLISCNGTVTVFYFTKTSGQHTFIITNKMSFPFFCCNNTSLYRATGQNLSFCLITFLKMLLLWQGTKSWICDSLQQKVPLVGLHLCLIYKHKPINNQLKRTIHLYNSGLCPLLAHSIINLPLTIHSTVEPLDLKWLLLYV